MDTSIFMDATKKPDDNNLQAYYGHLFPLWQGLRKYVFEKYPSAFEEWHYPGAKYGWSFRIKDKKRAILYLLPRDKYFKAAMVFGQKAFEAILTSSVSETIKNELKAAKVYAEGRGIRIDITNSSPIEDIKTLVDIKLAH